MKNFSIAFLIFLVWSFFALWLYSWLIPQNSIAANTTIDNTLVVDESSLPSPNKNKDHLNEITTENSFSKTKNETPIVKGLFAKDELGAIIIKFNENISFQKNSSSLNIPESLEGFAEKIKSYLEQYSTKEVHIISKYSAEENLETPNLGIQRGQQIAQILKRNAIPKEKIVIKPIIEDMDFDENTMYEGSISFQFAPLDKERVAALPEEPLTRPNKITFYPRFSNSSILKSEKLDQTLNEVKQILDLYPSTRIRIIGHTDNVGEHSDNYQKGLRYAEQVLWYFVAKGNIPRTRIEALSKGEIDPIQSNNTRKGRIANRRIEIEFR